MLINLHVKNLALIKEVDVDFSNGLIVLTGETGAGKSLLLGSVNIALGNKVSKDIIRNGEDFALVELTFSTKKEQADFIRNMDIFVDDDNIITVSRKITESRSVSKINGETVNVKTLKTIMEMLIDIHGQHDHQSLLYPAKHLEILDKFAKDKIEDKLADLKELNNNYKKLKQKLDEYSMDEAQRAREIEFAKFEVDEIEQADLKENEDVDLETAYKKMAGAKDVAVELSSIYQLISYENENGVGSQINRAISLINSVKSDDEKITQFKECLYDIDSMCKDLDSDIVDYTESLEFDSNYINEIENRLNTINHLKIKYGNSIEKILEYQYEKQNYLDELINYEEEINNIKSEIDSTYSDMENISLDISEERKKAALVLQEQVTKSLIDLNFMAVNFEIGIERSNTITDNGFDNVNFMISTNPGEPVRPLNKVASGGELSRIMLAIKSILASEDEIDTLIFDEIDTGISGKTATMVAEKMANISRHHQVICISHLSQIATMADNHYLIEKKLENNSTITNIKKLSGDESIEELVRINGDGTVSEAAISHAKEMKEMAERTKSYLI